jgi:ribonuclease D
MPQRPPDVTPELVQNDLTEEQLAHFLKQKEVAVDTETLGLNPLRDRLCMVQLSDRARRVVLVQIPAVAGRLAPLPRAEGSPRLKRLLEDPDVLKILHFARFDVAAVRHHLSIAMAPIFCTRTASKLVRTYTDRHGLKDVALELVDVEMDKTAQSTDWSRTDLSPAQLKYAVADVTLLHEIMDKLAMMLAREGRAALATECFRTIPLMSELDLMGYEHLFEH